MAETIFVTIGNELPNQTITNMQPSNSFQPQQPVAPNNGAAQLPPQPQVIQPDTGTVTPSPGVGSPAVTAPVVAPAPPAAVPQPFVATNSPQNTPPFVNTPPVTSARSLVNGYTVSGGLIIIAGLGATVISYIYAVQNNTGHYFIFWYAPLLGFLLFLRGLGFLPRSRRKK